MIRISQRWSCSVCLAAITAACALSSPAAAGERLAVLEFFGRPAGAYCSAAGPTMLALQEEYQGRAVLLEYHFDLFPSGRVDRFWATGSAAPALPLVMVGSGYLTSSGNVNYGGVYPAILDAELARPPRAELDAYWRRVGTSAEVYVSAHNLSGHSLLQREAAAIWVIAWEHSTVGVGSTWVRATRQWQLPEDLADGDSVDAVIEIGSLSGVSWSEMEFTVLLEERRPSWDRYDMLEAVEAKAAELSVQPESVLLNRVQQSVEVELAGPPVLSWTANAGVAWIEITPQSGSLPATLTIRLRPDLRPVDAYTGAVQITAAGDGMAFSESVEVAVGTPMRRAHGRRP